MRLTYKEIFARKEEIAKEVIFNYLTEKETASKYGCTPQLVKTFVRELRGSIAVPEQKADIEPPIKKSTGIMGLIDSIDNYHEFVDTIKTMYIKRKIQQADSTTAAASKMGLTRSSLYHIIEKPTHA